MPVLIAYFEAQNLCCLFANKRYANTFGLDEQSILGRTVQEIIGEAATREIQPHIDSILRGKLPAAYERQVAGRNGQAQWLEVNLLPHLKGEAKQGEAKGAANDRAAEVLVVRVGA